ncbi:hypothetical protein [Sphaerisporangium fuscum]|uniref:hypothetical protein n=1 Tax=Sphaerisporangium fuscum TaxID=2835868 RepID=UPI001BDBE26C|nr:hypothetical protein [Sphaerisporangium fuscum]
MSGHDDAAGPPPPAFLGLDEVLVLDEVVTPREQEVLCSWAAERRARGGLLRNPVDAASLSTPYLAAGDRGLTPMTRAGRAEAAGSAMVWVPDVSGTPLGPLPEEFWAIRARVIARLGIEALADDPYKGSFLTSVGPGGDVHTHKDARLPIGDGLVPLLRCNVLVRRPEGGGMPVIAGVEVDVPDRGMWAFHPTELVHGATPVTGETSRLTLSFGFVVDPRGVWERPLRPAPGLEPELVDGVRAHLRTRPMHPARAGAIDLLLAQSAAFRVRDIADALGGDPSVVWEEAHRLLKLGLLQSRAPEPVPGARRVAL